MSITDKIKRDKKEFGGLPFWSWNDKLEAKELKRQIRNMKDIGLNGFFMHARGGLATEYCSDEWYDAIKASVEEAKRLDMEAWAYDENGWPSGFAGGKLLEDERNFVTFLNKKIGDFDSEAFKVYALKDGMPVLVSVPDGSKEYLNVYREKSPSYVDILDKSIVKKFIEATHEEYKKRLGDDFGKAMPGFFTDEPQYYRYATAWSDTFINNFEKAYGYSVDDAIPALFIDFDGAKELRYDYWLLCHKQYIESFAKQIYDWCTKNGVQLTGHTIEESSLHFQMVCCGGVMPFYEYQHIPGIDHLTKTIRDDLQTKQIGSVAAQLNKRKVLTETFALCGWNVSPVELKRIAQWQYIGGVNLLCAHLYPYSERGERKYDYPAHYSEHLPWNKYLLQFNNYFANLGAALSQGKENVNVLILHPIRSMYLYFKRDVGDDSAPHIELPYHALLDKYSDNGVQYHLGDETIMARHGKVDGSKLTVGACSYDYVVIPNVETLDSSTCVLLKEFIKNGGKIVSEGDLPTRIDGRTSNLSWLKPNADFDDILTSREAYITKNNKAIRRMRLNVRTTENGRTFYLTNLTPEEIKNATLIIKNCNGVTNIDMLTLKEQGVKCKKIGNDLAVTLDFIDSGSFFLTEEKKKAYKKIEYADEKIKLSTKAFKLTSTPENTLVLDYAELSYDGVTYEKKRYIKHIHELLLKRQYEGHAYLKFKFNSEVMPKKLLLTIEPLKDLCVSINGTRVKLTDKWRIDRRFKVFDIAKRAVVGENEIVLSFEYYQSAQVYNVLFQSVMESLRNCLTLDTDIEAIYLTGDFKVDAKDAYCDGKNSSLLNDSLFTLKKQSSTVSINNFVTDGYPFFAGKMACEKQISVKESGKYNLKINGDFSVLNVFINGKKADTLIFDRECIVKLNEGVNPIKFEIINSMRNTFGPLHHVDHEPDFVAPPSFTNEGCWGEDSVAQNHTDTYAFVKFGINNITFTKLK